MTRKRRVFGATLKANVALVAVREKKTTAELATEFPVHASQVAAWKQQLRQPLQERIESVGDDVDLQAFYDTERQLHYVACTRARDTLLATAVEPASEFAIHSELYPLDSHG